QPFPKHSLMYPPPSVFKVEEDAITLKEFLSRLGREYLYAFERRGLGVLVNGKRLHPSAKLRFGDEIVIFPVISGG
ncbi:MoaD/ThiS family protein, partial [Candidatus Bathyarchaeota archaeon]|nr:MoaD/ThiS family protein [Candidatus Bathyarchaeota archaeon]